MMVEFTEPINGGPRTLSINGLQAVTYDQRTKELKGADFGGEERVLAVLVEHDDYGDVWRLETTTQEERDGKRVTVTDVFDYLTFSVEQ